MHLNTIWRSTAHYNPIQSIDNWEGLKKSKQEEFALLHATGGNKQFRKLYTDNVMLRYEGRSHIIETAIEGFATPESREREQEYYFDKSFRDNNFSIRQIEIDIKKSRDLMWSAYFNALSTKVLPNIFEQLDRYESHLRKKEHPKQRFNDFIARQALMIDLVRDYWEIDESTTTTRTNWY